MLLSKDSWLTVLTYVVFFFHFRHYVCEERVKFPMGDDPNGYVFLTQLGTRMREATGGTELLNLFANTNKFPDFACSPYDIRHFVSTWGSEQGGDLAAKMPGFMAHSKKTADMYYNHAQGTAIHIFCLIVMFSNSLPQLIVCRI